MAKTYRKKAFRLEIRRGENGGFEVRVDGDDSLRPTPEKAQEIVNAIGVELLGRYLRPAKIPKAREPTGI